MNRRRGDSLHNVGEYQSSAILFKVMAFTRPVKRGAAKECYYSGNKICSMRSCHSSSGRVFGRSGPPPSVQRTCGRQQARFIQLRTAPEDRCPRSRWPSLPARGSSSRLGGVAGWPESLAAARCGRKPAPTDISLRCAYSLAGVIIPKGRDQDSVTTQRRLSCSRNAHRLT
jgi:hypothetical protein